MELDEDEAGNLWLGAFRYYVGGTNTATHRFISTLINNLHDIPDYVHFLIEREILERMRMNAENEEGIEPGYLGYEVEVRAWSEVLNAINNFNNDINKRSLP